MCDLQDTVIFAIVEKTRKSYKNSKPPIPSTVKETCVKVDKMQKESLEKKEQKKEGEAIKPFYPKQTIEFAF